MSKTDHDHDAKTTKVVETTPVAHTKEAVKTPNPMSVPQDAYNPSATKSTLGKPATPGPTPLVAGAVDVHKMKNEADPTFDYTKGTERVEAHQAKLKEEKEEAEKEANEAKMKKVSDDELFDALKPEEGFEDRKTAKSRKAAKSAKGEKEKYEPKGAVAAMGGLMDVPWGTILSLLAKVGLPLAVPSLVKLRDRVAGTSWPGFIRNPIIAALDTLIAAPDMVDATRRRMAEDKG